jgi:hypothetical protein
MFTAFVPTCSGEIAYCAVADSYHFEHPHISLLKIATRLGAAVGILLILLGSCEKRPRMDTNQPQMRTNRECTRIDANLNDAKGFEPFPPTAVFIAARMAVLQPTGYSTLVYLIH